MPNKKGSHWMYALVVLAFSVCIGGCEDLLEVPDISNAQVMLLAPTDQSTVTEGSINFHWEAVADATRYRIQVATPNFENAAQLVLDSTLVVDSTFTGTSAIKNLLPGNFQWRVQAQNSDYQTAYSLSTFEVTPSN